MLLKYFFNKGVLSFLCFVQVDNMAKYGHCPETNSWFHNEWRVRPNVTTAYRLMFVCQINLATMACDLRHRSTEGTRLVPRVTLRTQGAVISLCVVRDTSLFDGALPVILAMNHTFHQGTLFKSLLRFDKTRSSRWLVRVKVLFSVVRGGRHCRDRMRRIGRRWKRVKCLSIHTANWWAYVCYVVPSLLKLDS